MGSVSSLRVRTPEAGGQRDTYDAVKGMLTVLSVYVMKRVDEDESRLVTEFDLDGIE